MDYWQKRKKVKPVCNVNQGAFAQIINKESDEIIKHTIFYYCRENFHQAYYKKYDTMLFYHEVNKGKNIAKFINAFECKLYHKKLTQFARTNINKILWIKPAKFWYFNEIRRSLFTALLRSGQCYSGNNFNKALYSCKYLNSTKKAVKYFLAGNTWSNDKSEWYDALWHEEDAINQILFKKPKPPK